MKRPQIDVTTGRNTTVTKVSALNYLNNTTRDEEREPGLQSFAFYVLIIINTIAADDD